MMKYFSVEEEQGNGSIPRVIDVNRKIKWEHRLLGSTHLLPEWNPIPIEHSRNILFPDYLNYPVPLFSELMQEVIEWYEPYLSYKKFLLYEPKSGSNALYYHPILPTMDSKDDLTLNIIGDKAIFQIGDRNKHRVVIRLDLIESMLRRDSIGVALTEIEIIEEA